MTLARRALWWGVVAVLFTLAGWSALVMEFCLPGPAPFRGVTSAASRRRTGSRDCTAQDVKPTANANAAAANKPVKISEIVFIHLP